MSSCALRGKNLLNRPVIISSFFQRELEKEEEVEKEKEKKRVKRLQRKNRDGMTALLDELHEQVPFSLLRLILKS